MYSTVLEEPHKPEEGGSGAPGREERPSWTSRYVEEKSRARKTAEERGPGLQEAVLKNERVELIVDRVIEARGGPIRSGRTVERRKDAESKPLHRPTSPRGRLRRERAGRQIATHELEKFG